jgi:hypothetical protein
MSRFPFWTKSWWWTPDPRTTHARLRGLRRRCLQGHGHSAAPGTLYRQGRKSLESAVRHQGRHHRLPRRGHQKHPPPFCLWFARPSAAVRPTSATPRLSTTAPSPHAISRCAPPAGDGDRAGDPAALLVVFPELTQIVQPLSGEYAGYREFSNRSPSPSVMASKPA